MGQQKTITHPREGRHLNRENAYDRGAFKRHKSSASDYRSFGRDVRTIEREIKSGTVEHKCCR